MPLSKQKIIAAICSVFLLLAPAAVQARGLVPCGGYDPSLPGGRERPCNIEDIFILVARVTNFLIAFAGVFAVYEIIGGGFWLIVSAGNEEAISKRKGQITAALMGFAMVLMAYMFVNTVVNFMITRSFVTSTDKGAHATTDCKLDLTSPLTYLWIDPKKCTSQPDAQIYKP